MHVVTHASADELMVDSFCIARVMWKHEKITDRESPGKRLPSTGRLGEAGLVLHAPRTKKL
jgi:hypothetical protein